MFAYFLGAVPIGVTIGLLRGVDLRAVGSGNIGATNAVRALGRGWGLVVFLLDVFKAGLPVWLAGQQWALGTLTEPGVELGVVAFFAFIGHIFPVYLRFRGGKGVACALGVFLVLDPAPALMGLFLYVQTVVLTRVSAVASLTGATVMAIGVLISDVNMVCKVLVLALSGTVWLRHASNLKEIIARAKASKRDWAARAGSLESEVGGGGR